MRLSLILVCLGVITACAAPPQRSPGQSPEALIAVFADEFHSGVMLEREAVPSGLLPAGGGTVPGSRWVVLHYGERSWIRGEEDGVGAALRLALSGGEGGVQIDLVPWLRHDRGGTDPARVRIWIFPATAVEVAGVVAKLRAWIAAGQTQEMLALDTCWWPSTRAWTLRNNCHDFTVDLLAGAGLGLDRPVIILADGMRASLDRVWAERAASW